METKEELYQDYLRKLMLEKLNEINNSKKSDMEKIIAIKEVYDAAFYPKISKVLAFLSSCHTSISQFWSLLVCLYFASHGIKGEKR